GVEGDSPCGGDVRDHSQNDVHDQVGRRGEDQVEEVVQAAEDEVDEAEQPLECGRETGEEVIDPVTERQQRIHDGHQCLTPSLWAASPVVAPAPCSAALPVAVPLETGAPAAAGVDCSSVNAAPFSLSASAALGETSIGSDSSLTGGISPVAGPGSAME